MQISIYMANPAMTALMAYLILREPLRPMAIAGIAFSFIGVVIVAKPTFLFGGIPWTTPHLIGELAELHHAVHEQGIGPVPCNSLQL